MLDINPRSECLGAEQSHASNKGAAEISMLRMDQLISHQKVLCGSASRPPRVGFLPKLDVS